MKKIIFIILYFIIIKYVIHILIPILISILFYYLIKPLVLYLEQLFHIRYQFIIYIFYILLLLSIVLFLYMICHKVIQYLPFIYNLYLNELLKYINIKNIISALPIVFKIPSVISSVFIFFISFLLLVIEYDSLKILMNHILSYEVISKMKYIKNLMIHIINQYIKCQAIICLINFVIILFCFTLLNIDYSFVLSLLACLLDIFPFIGIGLIMIPLIILLIMNNHYLSAFYIFSVYLFLIVLRELLEPYIMNKEYKMSLFLVFISMIIHFKIFGIYGLFLSYFHMYLFYVLLENDKMAL